MKFTLEWLKDHLETTADADEVSRALTTIGLEVESVEDQGRALKDFIVAQVVSAEKHPNADKLRVCKVDAGTGALIDVVCGAPNARAGMKSVFAFPGTYIPGSDFVLTKGNIRGSASDGMLCSGRELQLTDDHSGIIDLPEDAPVGARYIDYAGLNGAVFDISVTPNRGDATGVRGIARDLAAFGLGALKPEPDANVPSPGGPSPIGVDLRFDGATRPACPMFAGRLITGVRNGPSPEWLQARLRAIGLRPINTLVDITNFITHDRARPLHVFDADRLTGGVHARMGRAGESLEALDGKTYAIDESLCVIADDAGALGLGGIIGGEATGCTDATTNVFIECAWFDPLYVATAGRKLGIVTDARYRFERTVDPASVLPGIEWAARMVVELCGGVVHAPAVAGGVAATRQAIAFPYTEVKRLTGMDVAPEVIAASLERLGFALAPMAEGASVAPPSWRPDVSLKADVVEEVMRMVGVDNVPVTPLPRLAGVAPLMLTPIQNRRRIARRALAARGLAEAVTWSFIPEPEAKRFGGGAATLKLANPIASELTDMRPSLLPGLLGAAKRNANRGYADIALFEVGQVFLDDTPGGQRNHAAVLRTGTAAAGGSGRHWQGETATVGVFDAKADLAALLDALGVDIEKTQIVAEPAAWAHPGRGGRIQLGPKTVLGWFGEVHPALVTELDGPAPIVAFEADLDALPIPRRRPTRTKPALRLSSLMPVSRDFAFVVDRDVPAATILRAARGADKALVAGAEIFDVFEGAHVGAGKKSVAIAVTLQPQEKTLTDEEIERVAGAVIAAVTKATGGMLRA